MCGIFMCLLNKVNLINLDDYKSLFDQLSKRGPDFNQILNFDFELYKACLFSSVLDLRGSALVKQPIIEANDFLQFNGELYEIKNDHKFNVSNENDGLYLMQKLINCSDEFSLMNVLSSLRGEFSLIYWSSKLKTIYFGRDFFGKRSLCWNLEAGLFSCDLRVVKNSNDSTDFSDNLITSLNINNLDYNLCISSIAYYDDQQHWSEVPANGIYKICLEHKDDLKIELIRWKQETELHHEQTISKFLRSPISTKFNYDLLDFDQINDEQFMLNFELEFIEILRKSVELRVLKQNFRCKNCSKLTKQTTSSDYSTCNHSCLAILFSGGLDSTVLALLANEFMPRNLPIDLINLAFSSDAPDRKTGWSSYLEIKQIAPNRKWNFIVIDVTAEQLMNLREKMIKKIIYPLNTVLDDSIGCAIYFAGTGKGQLIQDDLQLNKTSNQLKKDQNINELINVYPSIEYETPSKILILGQGADEQLAGYSRHRTTFRIGGCEALKNELNLDINRISSRNLGRDDRMISSNGREARYPFLDENVVNFLNSLPINVKCDLNRPKGEGDKRLLRLVGSRIGLTECCKYEKRAIQFGSKIAKLENKKEKAVHISKRLI